MVHDSTHFPTSPKAKYCFRPELFGQSAGGDLVLIFILIRIAQLLFSKMIAITRTYSSLEVRMRLLGGNPKIC